MKLRIGMILGALLALGGLQAGDSSDNQDTNDATASAYQPNFFERILYGTGRGLGSTAVGSASLLENIRQGIGRAGGRFIGGVKRIFSPIHGIVNDMNHINNVFYERDFKGILETMTENIRKVVDDYNNFALSSPAHARTAKFYEYEIKKTAHLAQLIKVCNHLTAYFDNDYNTGIRATASGLKTNLTQFNDYLKKKAKTDKTSYKPIKVDFDENILKTTEEPSSGDKEELLNNKDTTTRSRSTSPSDLQK